MRNPLDALAGVLSADRTIHEPARLCVLTILSALRTADFVYVQKALGLTGGNLSTHTGKLAEAGFVTVEKSFVDNRSRTTLALTPAGRGALERYAVDMRSLLRQIGD